MDAITQAHYNLGTAYLNEKQYSEAIAAFQKAIALDADFAEAHGQLGLAYLELDRFDEAGAAAKEALRLNPNYQPALKLLDELKQEHYDSGLAFLTEEGYDGAIVAFKAAIDIDMGFIEAHHALGLAYLGTGKLDMAKQMAEAALKLDADYEPAQTLLNAIKPPSVPPRPTATPEARLETAPTDANVSTAQTASTPEARLETAPTDANVSTAQTASPETTEQMPSGEPVVVSTQMPETHPLVVPVPQEEQTAQPSPSEKEKHYEQGIAFLNNGQYELAIAAFKSAKNLDSNYRDAHYGLGLAYFRVGALDVAEAATQEALRLDASFLPALQLLDTIDAQDAAARKRRFWRRVAMVVGVVGVALVAFGAFRLGLLNAWLKPAGPPRLSITKVVLNEHSGDGFLNAGERGKILITIQNSGGDVRNVQVKLDPSHRAGLRYQPVLTSQLAGERTQTLTIPIAAESGIQGQTVKMNIDVIDKNGVPLASKPFSFQTQPLPLSPVPVR
ncbi:hypothetical protein C6495_12905 [Candidatus Poribacteria bacterium]|nr:MAG: hypothetical protein C6495_12905 [Candidatus Poribacteria bacterium]